MADAKFHEDQNSNLNSHRASGMGEMLDDSGNPQGGKLATTSTNINVKSNGMRVGFIQSLTPSENRDIVKVQELGTEGVVQSVPQNTDGGQLQVERLAVYNADLFNSLGLTDSGKFTNRSGSTSGTTGSNPFKTLKHQRVPLEIVVETTLPPNSHDGSGGEKYKETYVDCWLSSYQKTVSADQITVSEQATIQYSDVHGNYISGS
jgi:hypothetical protein